MIPFSLCKSIFVYGGKIEGINVGIPIPRFNDIPSLISLAALPAILNLISSSLLIVDVEDLGFLNLGLSSFFSLHSLFLSALNILSMKTPGT